MRIGDKIKVKEGSNPFYRTGDMGIVASEICYGGFWVNFNNMGNERVYEDGDWHVPECDLDLLP